MINLHRRICPFCNDRIFIGNAYHHTYSMCSNHYRSYVRDYGFISEKFYFTKHRFSEIENTVKGFKYFNHNNNNKLKFKQVFGLTNDIFKELELIELLS